MIDTGSLLRDRNTIPLAYASKLVFSARPMISEVNGTLLQAKNFWLQVSTTFDHRLSLSALSYPRYRLSRACTCGLRIAP